LVISYGFTARVITADDGSSIFTHGVDNTVMLTKLDPSGYRVWPQPVIAHYNDSSDFYGGGVPVSDGAGGAIVMWNDHRGAVRDPPSGEWLSNALYIQRVDSSGAVRWNSGGVLVSPAENGFQGGTLLTDGSGGTIVIRQERGFGYPGAPDRDRIVASRFNSSGERLWETVVDSFFLEDRLNLQAATRAGQYAYVSYYLVDGGLNYFTSIIDTSGLLSPRAWVGFFSNLAWRDSILFTFPFDTSDQRILHKIGSLGDTVWTVTFQTPGNCSIPSPFSNTNLVADGLGGVYYVRGCRDTVLHFESTDGFETRLVFPLIDSIGGYLVSDGHGGLVLANLDGEAQRYDSFGVSLWGPSPMIYQSDPENSDLEDFWGDNNGGIIAVFWTPTVTMACQHTGRYGQPGVVSVGSPFSFPNTFWLGQNYPNPFNPKTKIQYSVPRREKVRLSIFDVLGREVTELVNEIKEPGRYAVVWNPGHVASGAYFYRLIVGESGVAVKKMMLMR
jgi:hypothetical protein